MILRPRGKWNAALELTECSDIEYTATVLRNIAFDIQAEQRGEVTEGPAQVGDCIIIDNGLHIDLRPFVVAIRKPSVKVKIEQMFTCFDTIEEARAFVAEVRFEQEMEAA
jgi:hypothetical protein